MEGNAGGGERRRDLDGFSRVDRTTDPESFVRYLDTMTALEFFKTYKRRTFTLLNLKEGHRVLEVGCGTGEDAQAIARMVGATGRVVGIDRSEVMITEARRRAEALGLSLEFRVADAHRLDFADGAFDACRSDRTLQHLDDPARALAEMVRVTRSGGRLVLFDPDWETLVVDHPDRALTRKILRVRGDAIRNGWMGRRLLGLVKDLGLAGIGVTAETYIETDYHLASEAFGLPGAVKHAREAGTISTAEAAGWLTDLEARHRDGRFFSALTGYMVVARKPVT